MNAEPITNQFAAKPGSGISNKDAQIIGVELEKLGIVTAQEIVDYARDENSPLHPYFEWDDSVAAEEYRKTQARFYARVVINRETEIRSFQPIVIKRREEDGSEAFERSWGQSHAYVPSRVVREDPEMSKQVIEMAKRQLLAWKRNYEIYRKEFSEFQREFEPVFLAIDELENGN